jgi:two-component system response regulator YesN
MKSERPDAYTSRPRPQRISDSVCVELDKVPDIESVAQQLNISVSYARHLFKQETGVSYNRHVKSYRMQCARRLLAETNLRVKEVMHKVGINDLSHFVRDYKKVFGESPSETQHRSKQIRQ